MRNNNSLAQLAAQCEQRAKEVQSAGDREQLRLIARQLREMTAGPPHGSHLRLVSDAPDSQAAEL
jgi:hypothetical protein